MHLLDLQDRLAGLPPTGTLVLAADEAKQAFSSYQLDDHFRAAVADLAWLYQCSVVFVGPDDNSQLILFTRRNEHPLRAAISEQAVSKLPSGSQPA